ncbi:MAG: IS30 family transposase, partial [Thermoleophilia bacterium]|nr:IS30 family transposase [Thermoleophilia bacterium]
SLVDRKSGFTLIGKLTRKTARQVREAATGLLGPISNLVHTITLDNGKEFALHEDIARSLDAKIYFAHPYSSWGTRSKRKHQRANPSVLPQEVRLHNHHR